MKHLPLAALAIALASLYYGYLESRLREHLDDVPQELSLVELGESGPGDNAHLIVTDFALLDWSYVISEGRSGWDAVWIPAVPASGAYYQGLLAAVDESGSWPEGFEPDPPERIDVLVKLTDVRSETEVGERVSALHVQESMQGLVVDSIESLGAMEARILASDYPSVDFERCAIFEQGREPTPADVVLWILIGSALGVVISAAWWLRNLSHARREEAVPG